MNAPEHRYGLNMHVIRDFIIDLTRDIFFDDGTSMELDIELIRAIA